MFLSIVIAAYNEEGNIYELTQRIYSTMGLLNIPFEVIYVIDGDDQTFNILSELKKPKNNLTIDYSVKLRGFRNSFMKGFNLVDKRATHILTMDGDLNHQPEEIGSLIDAMNSSSSDIVIGSRYLEGSRVKKLALWKRLISIFANFVIKLIWHIRIHDKTSGFRLYKREVIAGVIPLCKSNNFEFLFEILLRAQKFNYKLIETPIIFKAREKGESKFKVWKTIEGYFKLMIMDFSK